MKNLKTLINVLLTVLPTSVAASTMSCDRYGYKAYEYLSKYGSNFTEPVEIAYWSMGENWTGATKGTLEITNNSYANIVAHLITKTCDYGTHAKCEKKGNAIDSGTFTLPARKTTLVNVKYRMNSRGSYGGIVYLAEDSYFLDSVEKGYETGVISAANATVDSQHSLEMTAYYKVVINPKKVGETTLTLPDTFVYDAGLDTGVGANVPFQLTNSTSQPITLAVEKILGDGTFVTVGNETLTEGDRSQPITGVTSVGLYLAEHAKPGTKSASVVAAWSCP